MRNPKLTRRLAAAASAAMLFAWMTVPVLAVSINWNVNGNANWNATGSWSGGVVPTANDTAFFPSYSNLPTITLSNNSVYGLSFADNNYTNGSTGVYQFTSSTLTLGAGGITAAISNTDTNRTGTGGNYLIGFNSASTLSLGADQTWTLPMGTSATSNPVVSMVTNAPVNLNGHTLTVSGGDWDYNQSVAASGGGALVINSAILYPRNNPNSSMGNIPVTINAGSLCIGNNATGQLGSTVTANAGSEFRLGAAQNGVVSTATVFNLNGAYFRANRGNYNGTVSYGTINVGGGETAYGVDETGAGTTAIQCTALNRTVANGAVLFAAGGLTVGSGATQIGRFTFSNNGTFGLIGGGGDTTSTSAKNQSIIPWAVGEDTALNSFASQGVGAYGSGFVTYNASTGIRMLATTNYDAALATAGDNVRLTATATNLSGQTANALFLDANSTSTAANLSFTGSGSGDLTITSGALLFGNSQGFVASGSTVTNLASIGSVDHVVFGSVGTPIDAVITVNAMAKNTTANPNTYTGGTLTINAPLTAANLVKSGAGTLVLTASQSYTGNTVINNGTIKLSGSGQLPSGTILNIYGSTVGVDAHGYAPNGATPYYNGQATAGENGMLDLNGISQSIAGLNGATGAGGGAYGVVTSASAATLTVNGGGVGGALTGSVALIKGGLSSDTLVLGGPSTFTGGAAANAGKLQFGNGASGADFAMPSASTITLASSTNLALAAAVSSSIAGQITGDGGVIINGATNSLVRMTNAANNFTAGISLVSGELDMRTDAEVAGASSAINFNGGILKPDMSVYANIDGHTVNWATFSGGFDIASGTFNVTSALGNGTGIMTKNGAGTLALASTLNIGTVNANAGTMTVADVLTATAVNVNPTSLLTLNGATNSLGTVTASGGTLTLNTGTSASTAFHLTGGTVNGSGSLSCAAPFDLQSGTLAADLTGANGATKTTTGTVTITAANALSGTFTFTAASAGTVNVQAAMGLGTCTVNVGVGNTLLISTPYSGVFGAGKATQGTGLVQLATATAGDSFIDLASGKLLQINVAQSGSSWRTVANPTGPLMIRVAAGALLAGNLTGAEYNVTGAGVGPNSIELATGALLHPTAGTGPSVAQVGDGRAIYPVMSNSDSAVIGAGTIYSKAQISNAYSPAAEFTGLVLAGATSSSPIELELLNDHSFSALALNTTGVVTISGPGKMTLDNYATTVFSDSAGALTVLRKGTGSANGNTNILFLGYSWGKGDITSGQTVQIQNGYLTEGNNDTGIASGAHIEILDGGGLQGNYDGSMVHTGTATLLVKNGGAVGTYINGNVGMDTFLNHFGTVTVDTNANVSWFNGRSRSLVLGTAGTESLTGTYVSQCKTVSIARDTSIDGADLVLADGAYLTAPAGGYYNINTKSGQTRQIAAATSGSTIGFAAFGVLASAYQSHVSCPISAAGSDIVAGGTNIATNAGEDSFGRSTVSTSLQAGSLGDGNSSAINFTNTVAARNLTARNMTLVLSNGSTATLSGNAIIDGGALWINTAEPTFSGGGYYQFQNGVSGNPGVLRGSAFAVAGTTKTITNAIHLADSAQAAFAQESVTGNRQTTVFNNVMFDGNAATLALTMGGYTTPSSGNGLVKIASLSSNAPSLALANKVSIPGYQSAVVQNFSGTGHVVIDGTDYAYWTLDGAINTGAFVHFGHGNYDMRIFDANQILTSNFQLSGGTFELDGGAMCTLQDTALVHTGTLIGNAGTGLDGRERLHIAYGEAGDKGAWGGGLTIQSMNAQPVDFYVNSNASTNLVNEFAGPLKVAAGDTGYFIGQSQGALANAGAIRFDDVELGNGSTLKLDRGTNLLGIWATSVTVNGTSATATISNSSVNITLGDIKGSSSGNTLNVDKDSVTFNGAVQAGTKLALLGARSYTLASTFALNGTLDVGNVTTTIANAAAFASGGFTMGNGASLGGLGKITGANIKMTGSNTLYGGAGTFTVGASGEKALIVDGSGNQISTGAVNVNTTTVNSDGELAVNGTLNCGASFNSAGTTDFNSGASGTLAALNVTAGTTTIHGGASTIATTATVSGGTLSALAGTIPTLTVNNAAASFTGGAGATIGGTSATVSNGAATFNNTNLMGSVSASGGTTTLGNGSRATLLTANGTATVLVGPASSGAISTVTTADFSAGTPTVNTQGNTLAISSQMKLPDSVNLNYTAGGSATSFAATGVNLAAGDQTLTLSGGTLTIQAPGAVPSSLLRHYTFDNSSALLADSGGNNVTGVASGSLAQGTADGKYGAGYLSLLDGNSYFVPESSAGNALTLPTTGWTFTAWVKGNTANSYRTLLHGGQAYGPGNSNTPYNTGYPIIADNATDVGIFNGTAGSPMWAGDTGYRKAPTGALPTDTDTWHFLAAVYDGTSQVLSYYLDNAAAPVGSLTSLTQNYGIVINGIGNDDAYLGRLFASALDDVYFYGAALTTTQLANVMNNVPDTGSAVLLPNTAVNVSAASAIDLNANLSPTTLGELALSNGATATIQNGSALVFSGNASASGGAGVVALAAGGGTTPALTIGGSSIKALLATDSLTLPALTLSNSAVSINGDGALGTVIFSGATTQTGTLSVTGGSLLVNGSLSASSAVTVGVGGTLGGSGSINGNVALSNGIIDLSGDGMIGGNLSVAGGAWAGSGTVAGASGVTVTSGVFDVNGTLTSSNGIMVGASGTLAGTGTILGAATIYGIHSPGNSPGIQTFGSDLTYNTGASVDWQLIANTVLGRGTNYDGIDVTGGSNALTFAGATTLNLIFNTGSSVLWSDPFWDTSHTGTGGWLLYDVAGTTSNFPNLSLASSNWLDSGANAFDTARSGSFFSVVQSGTDVYLQYDLAPIPEPSALALLALGGLTLLRRRRRDR